MPLCAYTSQTVGPFFHVGLSALTVSDLAGPDVDGERITLEGLILDGARDPIPDALVEIWQANAHGKYAPETEPAFRGFGRVATNPEGYFRFDTIRPGRVPGPNGKLQAPHIEVCIFMRGLLKQLVTRVYFADDPTNEADYVLSLIEPWRRSTLIARSIEAGGSLYRWNILLQGSDETVFFDI